MEPFEIIRTETPSYELWRKNPLTHRIWEILEFCRDNTTPVERACTLAKAVTEYYAEAIARDQS